MSNSMKAGMSWSLTFVSIVALILLDVVQKPMKEESGRVWAVGEVQAQTPAKSVVSIVRSDYAYLPERVASDSALTEAQVESMVREVVRLGGIEQVVRPEHRWIVIKPNIVELKEQGSGVITDWRVVKAIVKIVHEIAPDARITIAEGGTWIPPEREDIAKDIGGEGVGDGFEVAGYRQLLSDPTLSDIRLDLVNLNFDEAVETPVPGGGYVRESYFIPRTILSCDVLIDVPVLKVILAVGMTNAMKNFVGIAPGMIYGWPKHQGYPPGGGNPGIPHSAPVLDETIVELTALSGVDFTVVDAIVAMERDKTDRRGGLPVRMNTVLAGSTAVRMCTNSRCTSCPNADPAMAMPSIARCPGSSGQQPPAGYHNLREVRLYPSRWRQCRSIRRSSFFCASETHAFSTDSSRFTFSSARCAMVFRPSCSHAPRRLRLAKSLMLSSSR